MTHGLMFTDTVDDPKGVYVPIATSEDTSPFVTANAPTPASTPDGHIYVPVQKSSPSPRCWLWDKWLRGDFTIVPEEGSSLLNVVDVAMIGALIITAVAVPFQSAILISVSKLDVLISTVIDIILACDIIMTCNVAVITNKPGSHRLSYEHNPVAIARTYTAWPPLSDSFRAGWFWPDVVTSVPWDHLFEARIPTQHVFLIRGVRFLRMLRLLRVIKWTARTKHRMLQWRTRLGIPNSMVKIFHCASFTLLSVHWMACFWAGLGLLPVLSGDDSDVTWLSNHLTKGTPIRSLTPMQVYRNALYLCTVVLTSVGFGDITPKNGTEENLMIITCFITGITWAWVVANVVTVITSMDAFGGIFSQVMDDLNSLMDSFSVDKPVKQKARQHILESFNLQREKHHHEALGWLSGGLRGELAMQSGLGELLKRIWYLRDLDAEMVIEIADELVGVLFSPGEIIMDSNSVNVITRGTCLKNGRTMSRDSVFDEDMILTSDRLRDTARPRTLTFVEVRRLHRDSLRRACEKFPDLDLRMRRAQVKLALWRSFVITARQIKKAVAKSSQNGAAPVAWDKHFFSLANSDQQPLHSQNLRSRYTSWAKSIEEGEIAASIPSVSDESCVRILAEIEKLKGANLESQRASDRQWRELNDRVREVSDRVESLHTRLDGVDTKIQDVVTKQSANETNPEPSSPTAPSIRRSLSRKITARA